MAREAVNRNDATIKAGRLVRAWRRRLGLAAPRAAAKAGISGSLLTYIEGGVHTKQTTLVKIGAALRIPDSVLDVVLVAHGYLPTEATWQRLLAADRVVNGSPTPQGQSGG